MGIRGYGMGHIMWAIKVEKSELCTQDYLDQQASQGRGYYLVDEGFQEGVERARHFIFDELPMLGGTEFHEKLIYHLMNFTKDEEEARTIFNDIITICSNLS